MADIFLKKDAVGLLQDKRILFIGDSNMRAQYKDVVWLINNNSFIEHSALRQKLEKSFLGDVLINNSELTKGRDFREHRKFNNRDVAVEFMFVTRCLCPEVEEKMDRIKAGFEKPPHVLVMNSCIWDITRWGPDGPSTYRENMTKLMELLKLSLPKFTLVLWTTVPPTASRITGGLIIKQIEFLQETLRFELMASGQFIRELVEPYAFDVIDFHYYLQFQVFRRSCDGVHYLPSPVRFMTNLLLTHICLSWGKQLPGNVMNKLLKESCTNVKASTEKQLAKLECIADTLNNNGGKVARKEAVLVTPIRASGREGFKGPRPRGVPRDWQECYPRYRGPGRVKHRNRNFKPYNRH